VQRRCRHWPRCGCDAAAAAAVMRVRRAACHTAQPLARAALLQRGAGTARVCTATLPLRRAPMRRRLRLGRRLLSAAVQRSLRGERRFARAAPPPAPPSQRPRKMRRAARGSQLRRRPPALPPARRQSNTPTLAGAAAAAQHHSLGEQAQAQEARSLPNCSCSRSPCDLRRGRGRTARPPPWPSSRNPPQPTALALRCCSAL
jgi:hypothetical protein